jgi:hypothetical protein
MNVMRMKTMEYIIYSLHCEKFQLGKGQENNVIAYFLRAYGCFNWYSKN